MTEKIREQFEARYPVPFCVVWSDEKKLYTLKDSGEMTHFEKRVTGLHDVLDRYSLLWEAWQDSRARIEVELPESRFDYESIEVFDAPDVRQVLEAQGLRVKP